MSIDRKSVFDDMFDCFTILSGEKYVSLYDAKTMVTRWSPNAVKMFKLPGEYLDQGAYNWEDSIHPDDKAAYRECMAKLTTGTISGYDISYRVRIMDGSYIMCRNRGSVIRSEDGMPDFIGGNVMNVGVLDREDPLTGLRTAKGLKDDLKLYAGKNTKLNAAILEIEDFGGINDAYGYSFGNKFLLKLTDNIRKELAGSGTLYRAGGVRFIMLSDTLSAEELRSITDKFSEKLKGRFAVDGIVHSTDLKSALMSLDTTGKTEMELYGSLMEGTGE